MRDVILHAFDWPFVDIAARAPSIAAHGYGAVLFASPLYSEVQGTAWWQRYQPKDYRVIRSFLGRKRDLVDAIDALHAVGVRAYIDLVFNHMANEKHARPDDPYHFPGARELARYADPAQDFESDRLYGDLGVGLFSPHDFNPGGDIVNWNCPWEVAERWLSGLPDLDLNPWVVEQQRRCLRALNDLGADGYRVDAFKHLPREHLRQVFETGDVDGKFVFGEVLTSGDRHEALFLWPIIANSNWPCYDFPLHETMLRAFAPSGSLRELVDPAAHGQALPWHRAVTFTVTHDIPHNFDFRSQLFDRHDEHLAHVFVLGRDGGVPLLYSDGNQSAARHPEDRDRWHGLWERPDITRMIAFHNAVHGTGQRSLYDDDGFLVFARGDRGIVAINKTERWQKPVIRPWGLRPGPYRCLLHQQTMTVDDQPLTLVLPPRQAHMWLRE